MVVWDLEVNLLTITTRTSGWFGHVFYGKQFPYFCHPSMTRLVTHGEYAADKPNLAAGAKVSLRPALPFPRLLLLLPDRVQTPRNTSAICL